MNLSTVEKSIKFEARNSKFETISKIININENNLGKPIFYFFLAVGLFCFLVEPADAHRVNVFAWVEGDTVHVESKFSGGKKVNAGKIIVIDPRGAELVKGTTNAEGEFSFKVPEKTDLKIVLLAGEGHRAEWTIDAAELSIPATGKRPVTGETPGIKEILIGIGCIFGLTGIAAYLRKRKTKNLDHESTKI